MRSGNQLPDFWLGQEFGHQELVLRSDTQLSSITFVAAAVLRKNIIQSHAAISSSQYSWCSPPRTSLILIRRAAGNSCRLSFGLANGFLLRMPGPKLECGRP